MFVVRLGTVAFSHQTIVKFILKMHLGFQLEYLGLQMVLPIRNSKNAFRNSSGAFRDSSGAFRIGIGAFRNSSGVPSHELKRCV